ncbi:MAG: SGNH/GDSL hydrolase family protein [Selenomonadaceae bacterium]|nr:SGNH/GDSL hydrolase family protein [Selenomonadaceae bacterium]MBP3722828.1 SGNH/GDSL hydrolase family protein [Selenomonadaceae bacterium]
MNRSDFLKIMTGGALGLALFSGGKENAVQAAAGNLKIDCFGDSTTWGADGIGKGDGNAISWVSHLKTLIGVNDIMNIGKKGSRFAITSDRKDSFVERVGKVRADSNVVLVMGGVNDFNNGVPLGALHDGNKNTFYGAVEFVLTTLIAQNPSRDIVFMTPMKSKFVHATKKYPNSWEKNSQNLSADDYVNAMKEVCGAYSVPVIDMFNESGISPFAEAQQKKYMPDALHYNEEGYKRLAKRIAAGLRSVVYDIK